MRLVCVLVRPHEVEGVTASLEETGVQGMTAVQVNLPGARTETYRGNASSVDEAVVRLECAVEDAETTRVLAAALTATGLGPAWSTPLDMLVRVRTGERGADAL